MKKLFPIILFSAVLGMLAPRASAHVFAQDGFIEVLMHSNPDDDPIAGQPGALLFSVTDSTKHFDAAQCDCAVAISRQGTTLFSGPLLRLSSSPSIYSLTLPFTFPARAVYHIIVSGSPKTPGGFQKFRVEYDLRVDRGVNVPSSGGGRFFQTTIFAIIAVCVVLVGGLVVYFVYISKRKQQL